MRIPFLSRLLNYQRERRHERQLREAVATEVYEANERRKQKRQPGTTNPYVGASRSDTRSPYYDPTLDPLSPLSPLSPFSPLNNHPDYNERLQQGRENAWDKRSDNDAAVYQDSRYDFGNAQPASHHHHDSGSSSSSSYDSGSSSSSDSGSSGGSSD